MRSDAQPTTPTRPAPPGAAPEETAGRRFAGWVAPGGRDALALRLADARDRLVDAARRDLDGGLALPGLVVVFACGIGLYFELPREPWPPAVAALALLAVTVTAIRRRRGHPARVAAVFAALVLGVLAASWETRRVAAPRLDHERTVTVEGRVVDLEATAPGGLRLVVDVHRMEGRGLEPASTPSRITATLTTRGWRPDVGDGVRFKARLKPPEGPVMPGGYDFARRAWFEGRGAGGYVLGRATPLDLGPPEPMERLTRAIGRLRHTIAERVRAALPGETGTIAAALMVGEQRAIPESAAEPLRASGLTHIVSISGLHMGLVAGGVIVVVRALLALFPGLALGRPIKKWAAAAAFVVATAYLLLSGIQVAALRSHLMLSVALLAVLVDRPAITMHTVAVAAVAILAFEPSAVMEPSFRMSFLAVIALVAAYDLYRARAARRPPPRRDAGLAAHLAGGGLRQIEGFAFSSLVAGLATAPVIAGTFFRAAPYSIFANMAVLPVTGLVIMPAAVVAALAMPFGLEVWPLAAMGLGIDWMIAVGRWAAALPAGAGLLGEPHPAMMPLGIAAVLWLSAWKSRIRLFGLVPALAAIALVFAGPRSDVLIGRHGTAVAVRGADGRLHVLGGRQERFDTGIWLAADRDSRPATATDLADGWRCDPLGCVFRLPVAEADAAHLRTAIRRTSDRFPVAADDPAGHGPPRSGPPSESALDDVDQPPATTQRDADRQVEAAPRDTDRQVEAALPEATSPIGPDRPDVALPSEAARHDGAPDPRTRDRAAPPRSEIGAIVRRPDGAPPRDDPGDVSAEAPVLEIAVIRHPQAFDEDCRRAAVVVTTLIAPPACRAVTTVVDRLDLARNGATTLDFTGPLRELAAAPRPRSDRSGAVTRPAPIEPTRDPTSEIETRGEDTVHADDHASRPGDFDPNAPEAFDDPLPDTAAPARSDAGPSPGAPGATDTADAHPLTPAAEEAIRLRRDVRIRTALPPVPRPWTPIDPRLSALEDEVTEVEDAFRMRSADDRDGPNSDRSQRNAPDGPR